MALQRQSKQARLSQLWIHSGRRSGIEPQIADAARSAHREGRPNRGRIGCIKHQGPGPKLFLGGLGKRASEVAPALSRRGEQLGIDDFKASQILCRLRYAEAATKRPKIAIPCGTGLTLVR